MVTTVDALGHVANIERSCALTAYGLSGHRRVGARLVGGRERAFGLNASLSTVYVPYPALDRGWTQRSLTCAIALQCAPSKDRLAGFRLDKMSGRELTALTLVEAGVAFGWALEEWPGLAGEFRRLLPDWEPSDADMSATQMLYTAVELADSGQALSVPALMGSLPRALITPRAPIDGLRRTFGRLPWTSTQKRMPRAHSVPVGGEGGVRGTNLPPPGRPQDDDADTTPEHRQGIPYPEWNLWTGRLQPDHVAVVERPCPQHRQRPVAITVDVRKWFEKNTDRAMRTGLDDGSDIDVDAYTAHRVEVASGVAREPRIFGELSPAGRDVTTALLLDGSSSLSAAGGAIFRLELACADALSRAMTSARERHGVFIFTGNTRHHVEVTCLKDFPDRRFAAPGALGLSTGGYTRLGAPIRHMTHRLLAQPSARRLLIVLGDGLVSDEGYEGRYAWADVAHAVREAEQGGVTVYYIGIGAARVDPLPEVFGPRRSQRIRRAEDLPRVLAHVHRQLVSS
ncbi:VWA domain-containing protein [Mycolicibacterium sp. 120266]|uniref:nitric oxide reductase activation protein NorD n=1 Tax=Mycolicibacterium sp. 120266 TaxID=3090601 RepID=UPI00299E4B63|nr:VWA domain-containing protein [Mycolicibacterium sp. 120266]MDX1873836.1 VWA domain-containing protein [Mycolicibacterium sp. 120266]